MLPFFSFFFYLLDDGQHPGLAFFGPVGTNTKVDLVGERIGLVGGRERKDDILWCSGHLFKQSRYKKWTKESGVRTIFFERMPWSGQFVCPYVKASCW